MASALYDKGRKAILDADIDALVDTLKVELVRTVAGSGAGGNTVYTVNLSTDQYLSDIPSNSYCRPTSGQPQTLANKTTTAGVFDADDATFTSVASGDAIQALVIYKSTGTASTSPLIAYIDGKITVTLAQNASANATSLKVDPLLAALASGTTIIFAGAGVTVTLASSAAVGARTLAVSDIGSTPITAGDSGPAYTSGVALPITPNGGNITITWDSGSNKIFKL